MIRFASSPWTRRQVPMIAVGGLVLAFGAVSFDSRGEDAKAPTGERPAVRVEVLTNMVLGAGKPGLRIVAFRPLSRAKLTLSCEGKAVVNKTQPLDENEEWIVEIERKPGVHACKGSLDIEGRNGAKSSMPLNFTLTVLEPLKLRLLSDRYDREGRKLQVTADRAVTKLEWKVIGDDGGEAESKEFRPDKPIAAGDPIEITWATENPIRIDVTATDEYESWSVLEISPWWVEIAHEDVHFASGSAEIPATEKPKLDAAFAEIQAQVERYGAVVRIQLYVAGYTDTVSDAAYNRKLSQDRARAIAQYFRSKGFKFPIHYQGFGEDALAVPTPDNTPHEANRRAAYILAADMPPTGPHFPRAAWTRLK